MNQQDDNAWADFVAYYSTYLRNLLRRYGLNNQDCQDVIQNTLLKVWKLLPQFSYDSSKGRFRSWITRIAINTMKAYLADSTRLQKAIKERKLLPPDEKADHFNEIIEQEWRSFVAEQAWEHVSIQINDLMKQVFEMFMADKSNTEIATALQIPESSVRVYQRRVRLKLNHEVARLEQELN